MYLRESKQKRADGREVVYLQLAENVWDPARGRSQARIVYNCGRADDAQVVERLRRLAKSILCRCSPGQIVADCPDWRLVCAWPYGDVYALEAVWRRLGLDAIIRVQSQGRRFGFEMERALFAMVANRACAPGSKLYCWEQWLQEEVLLRTPLASNYTTLPRDGLSRGAQGEIEKAIFFHVADLLNVDVDLIFYDTTSLHFEIDDEDEGDAGRVCRSAAAGAKTYAARESAATRRTGATTRRKSSSGWP